MDLNLLWFVLLGVLLAGYAILDGFDLGVGIIHLTARNNEQRRMTINSIGPHWDGNEVWLVTFGGAMFAAFPNAYATIFSGFYIPFMILLFALIFRAVSIEFRSKRESKAWRSFWDWSFFAASALATLLFGVAAGNALIGISVNAQGYYVGSFFDLIRPFPILVGLLAVFFAAMHGSVYLYLKTEGELQKLVRPLIWRTFIFSLFLYLLSTFWLLVKEPQAVRNFYNHPWSWAIVALFVLAFANIPRMILRNRPFYAFLSSSSAILALVFLFSFTLYPNLVVSTTHPFYLSRLVPNDAALPLLPANFNLTIYNAASSQKTLGIMAIIALIGMPLVLAYTAAIYWAFRGKVKITDHSY